MANKTVRLFSGDLAGETGLTLELINPDTGAVGNGAGDSLTEVANGLFETTVTEAITGWWKATVKKGAVIYASGGNLYIAADVEASYAIDSLPETIPAATMNAMLVDYTSTGTVGWILGILATLVENVTGWRFTTKALEQAPGGSASGSGARTVTVTVNDGTTALQNARVRMTEGVNTYTALTNASGVATFNLDDATYTVAITKAGYSYAGTTLVVDGTEAVTYSMSSVTITPSNPSFVTGYYTCYSELGVVESGVTISLEVHKVPTETGLALDSAVRTATSDGNGLAQFTNLVPGTTYKVKRGEGNYYTVKIADNATGSVELNSILGT